MASQQRESSAEESEWAGFSERSDGDAEGDDDMDFEVRFCDLFWMLRFRLLFEKRNQKGRLDCFMKGSTKC